MVSARYVADCLYRRDVSPVPGILVTSLILLIIPATILSMLFYTLYATMDPLETIMSIINFVLLAEIWLIMLYLSCLRNYGAISLCWTLGMVLAVLAALYFGELYAINGMLIGLNCGLVFLLFSLLANILAEYPYPFTKPKDFSYYFKHYKGLFWSGLMLFTGMWIDKVIMWSSPEAVTHLSNLTTYPLYDGAMFLSYMTIIPAMALFIFSIETNFYVSYIQYIRNIEFNRPLSMIEDERKNIIQNIIENGRSFLILQGSLSLAVILLSPTIFAWLGLDFLELSIFRLGVLGAFFGALCLIIVIFFSYFDTQENMIRVSGLMLLTNVVFTLISQHLGFAYYGYGYCLSMMVSFIVGAILLVRLLDRLNYHIFISNVVKRHKFV